MRRVTTLAAGLLVCLLPGCTKDRGPWYGESDVLVLPLVWAGTQPDVSPQTLEERLFSAQDSLAAWFLENSHGRYRFSGEVLPWRETSQEWRQKAHRCGPDAVAAIALQVHAGAFDLARHDRDGNGRVDDLLVIHTARGNHDRVSHRCVVTTGGPADRLTVLQLHGLGRQGEALPIGLYIHEGAHVHYDLDDLYGDSTKGDRGIGVWGLMGTGQWGPNLRIPREDLWARPVTLEAFNKERLGWLETRSPRRGSRNLRLPPVETSGQAFSWKGRKGVRYVAENRGDTGFSAGLPGNGLLLWRISESGRVALIQADGRNDLGRADPLPERPLPPNDHNFGDGSDPFPGTLDVSAWSSPNGDLRLTNIRKEGADVVFDLPR